MVETNTSPPKSKLPFKVRWRKFWGAFSEVPLIGWLLGILAAVVLEQLVGAPFARLVGLSKVPVLFGFVIVLGQPRLIPGTLIYLLLIYGLPLGIITLMARSLTNKLAGSLAKLPLWVSALIHVAICPD